MRDLVNPRLSSSRARGAAPMRRPGGLARSFALGAIMALAGLGISAVGSPAGAAVQPALECGTLPTGDVALSADLTCESGFHFGSEATPVSIDLAGHTLTVTGTNASCSAPGPCGAIAGATQVRNGTVNGALSDIGSTSGVTVNGDVLLALGQSGVRGPATIRGSVVTGAVRAWGADVTIDANIIGGGVAAVDTNTAVRNLTVSRNWILHSPRAGVSVVPVSGFFSGEITGSIDRNLIWGSNGPGIELGGFLGNIGSLRIDANQLILNRGDGFVAGGPDVGPPTVGGPVAVSNNRALLNRGNGIDAGWIAGRSGTGIVDGGGNQAVWNSSRPACIGVTCR